MEESSTYRTRPVEDVQDTIFLRCPLKTLVFLALCLVCPLQEEPSDPLWTSEVFTLKRKAHYMELKLF